MSSQVFRVRLKTAWRPIAASLGARRQVDFLARSVDAPRNAVMLADLQVLSRERGEVSR